MSFSTVRFTGIIFSLGKSYLSTFKSFSFWMVIFHLTPNPQQNILLPGCCYSRNQVGEESRGSLFTKYISINAPIFITVSSVSHSALCFLQNTLPIFCQSKKEIAIQILKVRMISEGLASLKELK